MFSNWQLWYALRNSYLLLLTMGLKAFSGFGNQLTVYCLQVVNLVGLYVIFIQVFLLLLLIKIL